jgi:voltage-gated potassium channel
VKIGRSVVIAIVLVAAALNIVVGVHLLAAHLPGIPLSDLTDFRIRVLGRGTQAFVGVSLVGAAVLMIFRLRAGWVLALMLSVVLVLVNALNHQFDASLAIPVLLLAALIATRNDFGRNTSFVNYFISALAIAFVLSYGVIGSQLLGSGFDPKIQDGFTALYFTIMTLSTVGYGDIVPVTPEARLFAITLVVFGIGIFLTAIASSLGPALAGQIGRFFRTEPSHMESKDHIILVGSSAVAENTARQLEHRKVPYVRVLATSDETHPLHAIIGDATEEEILQNAGIANARMLIAAGENDSDNAFVALLAKDLNPKAKVLIVARSERSIPRLKLARADLVFAPAVIGGRLIADIVEGGSIPAEFGDLLEKS